MLIDCDTCTVRGDACRDCVVTMILDRPRQPVDLDDEEQAAVGSLAAAGLLPPLRLVRPVTVAERGIA
ncbi:MAG TPA: hypothetical protein VGN35_03205 [Jatrophihabitantaceae bacterium]|jgi:hypothetical protein|nr:hypothetical protein [Jatrophihabitantaceae bacterium]